MSTIIKQLQCPDSLESGYKEFCNLTSQWSTKKTNDLCIHILTKVYRLLDDDSWTKTVNLNTMCTTVAQYCKHVKDLTEDEYKNFLIILYNLYKYVVKEDVQLHISNLILNVVYSNPKFPLVSINMKIYFDMLTKKIIFIESKHENKSNNDILTDLMSNIVQFTKDAHFFSYCKTYLSWLVRKLFVIYNETLPSDLELAYGTLFTTLLRRCEENNIDMTEFEPHFAEIYKNVMLCLTLLTQTIVACNYKSSRSFNIALKFSMTIFKSKYSYLYYINLFCSASDLFTSKIEDLPTDSHKLITKLMYFNKNDKLKDDDARGEFLTSLRKILNILIVKWCNVNDDIWKKNVSIEFQVDLSKLIFHVTGYLHKYVNQSVVCNNCEYKSCVHDGLQFSLSSRSILNKSVKMNIDVTKLDAITCQMVDIQTEYVIKLRKNNCPAWQKFWDYVQNYYSNDTVLLHSVGRTEQSLNLFKAYIKNCLRILKLDADKVDFNSLSRSYYNMQICMLDLLDYEGALKMCYLGMALKASINPNYEELDLFMKCVIQIKSRAQDKCAKGDIRCECSEKSERIQSYNIWKLCREQYEGSDGEIFSRHFHKLNFSKLLLFELETYSKLWFSTWPIIGIYNALQEIEHMYKNNTVYKILDSKSINELPLIYAKAATLFNSNPSKIYVPEIRNFIKYTVTLIESLDFSLLPSEEMLLVKLLYGNCLNIHYECLWFENCKNEPPPCLLTEAAASSQPPHITVHPDDICDVSPTQQSLSLSMEEIITKPLLKAVDVWSEVIKHPDLKIKPFMMENSVNTFYVQKSVEVMDIAIQMLSLRQMNTEALKLADVAYSFATLAKNKINILRIAGFIIENVYLESESISAIIETANIFAEELLRKESSLEAQTMDTVYDYLINLSIYYFNCKRKDKSALIFATVHNKILTQYFNNQRNIEDIKFSYSKLTFVQSMFISEKLKESVDCFSLFTNVVEAYVACSDLVIESGGKSGRLYLAALRLWINCGLSASKITFMLGLPRRSRAILRSVLEPLQRLVLPVPTAEILLLLAIVDVGTERFDDCRVKLDSLQYIMEETDSMFAKQTECIETESKINRKIVNDNIKAEKMFEMVLDVPINKYSNKDLGGSPIFETSPFTLPSFIDHQNKCNCKKCSSIKIFELILGITHLKSQLYFKTAELNAAYSFYDGGVKLMHYLNCRFKHISNLHFKNLLNFQLENVQSVAQYRDFAHSEIRFYIDAGFYFVTENDLSKTAAFNEKALNLLSEYPPHNFLLQQFAYEQRVFLLQLKIFPKMEQTSEKMLDLVSNDLEKLQLTPEKLPPNSFKTPCNKTVKPVIQINRIKRNLSKNLDENFSEDRPEFIKPIIKLDLDGAEVAPEINIPEDTAVENVEKTPAPKIRNKKLLLMANTSSRKTKNATSSKSLLVRSTSPGSLNSSEFNFKTPGTIRSSSRIKREAKINLSPDVDLVKKYSIRRKL